LISGAAAGYSSRPRDGGDEVTEINRHLHVARNLLSHHLRILRQAGLVVSRRDGKAMTYALAPGVEGGPPGRAINLGCCAVSFKGGRERRRVS
jgi:ArsR family transcriptional regulator, nickel/cobalt-responsive transcriptional repressor